MSQHYYDYFTIMQQIPSISLSISMSQLGFVLLTHLQKNDVCLFIQVNLISLA